MFNLADLKFGHQNGRKRSEVLMTFQRNSILDTVPCVNAAGNFCPRRRRSKIGMISIV